MIVSVFLWPIQEVNKYDQEMPQSHTEDQSMAPWGKVTEHLQNSGNLSSKTTPYTYTCVFYSD